jgi:hypothetical protein
MSDDDCDQSGPWQMEEDQRAWQDFEEEMRKRGYTITRTSTPEPRIEYSPGCNPLDSAQQGKAFTLDEFIAEVERVTRVALLRELAAELDDPKEHLHCVANAKDTPQEFRRYLAKSLGERAEFMEADALEKGTPT